MLLYAKHLFVAAMVAWVHPGCRNRQIKYDGGKSALPWDMGTLARTDPPLFMRLSFQSLREALAGSMPASFHHAASLPRADCSSRPLWLPVRNKYLAPINKSRRGTNSRAANGKTRYGSALLGLSLWRRRTAGKTRIRTVVQTLIVALAVACCASACTQEQRACARLKEHRFPICC